MSLNYESSSLICLMTFLSWLLPKSISFSFYQEMIVNDIVKEEFPDLYSQNISVIPENLKEQL